MTYVPPGVTPSAAFGPGVHHACILAGFKEAKPSTSGKYLAAFIATYRDTEARGAELEEWIRFDGSKKDYYSGLRIERLHAIVGAPEPVSGQPVDCQALLELSDGVFFTVEVEENGQYLNVKDVRANGGNTDAEGF